MPDVVLKRLVCVKESGLVSMVNRRTYFYAVATIVQKCWRSGSNCG